MCTNAYKRELGGVFMEEGQVVCYESRNLNVHQHTYVAHDLQLALVIHVLKMWGHYHPSRRFILVSDNSGLSYLFDQLNLNSRKSSWLATISEFDFEIRYIKGKETRLENSRSRRI